MSNLTGSRYLLYVVKHHATVPGEVDSNCWDVPSSGRNLNCQLHWLQRKLWRASINAADAPPSDASPKTGYTAGRPAAEDRAGSVPSTVVPAEDSYQLDRYFQKVQVGATDQSSCTMGGTNDDAATDTGDTSSDSNPEGSLSGNCSREMVSAALGMTRERIAAAHLLLLFVSTGGLLRMCTEKELCAVFKLMFGVNLTVDDLRTLERYGDGSTAARNDAIRCENELRAQTQEMNMAPVVEACGVIKTLLLEIVPMCGVHRYYGPGQYHLTNKHLVEHVYDDIAKHGWKCVPDFLCLADECLTPMDLEIERAMAANRGKAPFSPGQLRRKQASLKKRTRETWLAFAQHFGDFNGDEFTNTPDDEIIKQSKMRTRVRMNMAIEESGSFEQWFKQPGSWIEKSLMDKADTMKGGRIERGYNGQRPPSEEYNVRLATWQPRGLSSHCTGVAISLASPSTSARSGGGGSTNPAARVVQECYEWWARRGTQWAPPASLHPGTASTQLFDAVAALVMLPYQRFLVFDIRLYPIRQPTVLKRKAIIDIACSTHHNETHAYAEETD
ncbi:hypothetical protein CYMTET_22162 [Cymbomonas tetramitiformis]|uniref:Uncharacterized protein n=1 Tax=Cymbomonas tetramitiformis TaxID=36881 RepID=A0AAE0G0T2_9CHLO|nr:hypothetical protein CYMTET_22162 [Cymbomonas tetramitiformis]